MTGKSTSMKKKTTTKTNSAGAGNPDYVTQGQHETSLRRIRDLEERIGHVEARVTGALGLPLTDPEPTPAEPDPED